MDKLSERLNTILPKVFHEQIDNPGTSKHLSEAQGMVDEVAQLEAKNEDLRHLVKEGLEWSDENIENYLRHPKSLSDALKAGGEPWDKEVVGDEEWY